MDRGTDIYATHITKVFVKRTKLFLQCMCVCTALKISFLYIQINIL